MDLSILKSVVAVLGDDDVWRLSVAEGLIDRFAGALLQAPHSRQKHRNRVTRNTTVAAAVAVAVVVDVMLEFDVGYLGGGVDG